MTTSWDINALRQPDLGLQRSGRTAKIRSRSVTTIAMVVSALACIDAISTTLPPVKVSSPILKVSPVQRASPVEQRPARGGAVGKKEFFPDVTEGISSGRLAGIFTSIFEPLDEPEVDVDYSFG
jgi:hypothetical protein